MLKKILAVVAVVVIGAVGFIATRPDTYHVERTVTVAAPAQVAFDRINSFQGWEAWSPWAKLDPAMAVTYTGPGSGVGAKYAWDSKHDNVGSGEMTIVESKPAEKVGIDLHFIRPFEDQNLTTFVIKSEGADASMVTWSMDGHTNLMSKAMGVFMDMDAMIGPDFERGLAALKAAAEGDAAKQAAAAKKAAEVAAVPVPVDGATPPADAPASPGR